MTVVCNVCGGQIIRGYGCASVFKRPGNRWFARYKAADGCWRAKRVRQLSRRDALRVARKLEADEELIRVGLKAAPQRGELCGVLMKRWGASLTNRSRDTDLCRIDRHLMPRWKGARLSDVTLASVTAWLDDLAETDLSSGTRRHLVATLSRFLSWCQQRGHVERNVVRDLPPGSRPRPIPPPPESIPWLRDDADVLRIMRALPAPFDAIFFVGNRSGARLSEILALRLSDLADIDQGAIRARFAGDDGAGPLKEDKHGAGRMKWIPIPPADARAMLGPIVAARRLAGVDPEAFLFVDQDGDRIDRHAVGHRWRAMRAALGLPRGLSFYRGTRHSAASRALAAGAALAEISDSLGHASEHVTRAHYLHVQRRTFSPILIAGLGLERTGKVVALPAADGERGRTEPAEGTNAA